MYASYSGEYGAPRRDSLSPVERIDSASTKEKLE
jgi:hypothetical protein